MGRLARRDYRARTYDASTGRFLQEDPIGLKMFDSNPYEYANLIPLSFTDPTGFVAFHETGAFAQAAGTSGPISNAGLGLACLFSKTAMSVKYKADMVSGRGRNIVGECGVKTRNAALYGGLFSLWNLGLAKLLPAFEIEIKLLTVSRNPYFLASICKNNSVCLPTAQGRLEDLLGDEYSKSR